MLYVDLDFGDGPVQLIRCLEAKPGRRVAKWGRGPPRRETPDTDVASENTGELQRREKRHGGALFSFSCGLKGMHTPGQFCASRRDRGVALLAPDIPPQPLLCKLRIRGRL